MRVVVDGTLVAQHALRVDDVQVRRPLGVEQVPDRAVAVDQNRGVDLVLAEVRRADRRLHVVRAVDGKVRDLRVDRAKLGQHGGDLAALARAAADGTVRVDPLQHDDPAEVVGKRVLCAVAVGERERGRRLADAGGVRLTVAVALPARTFAAALPAAPSNRLAELLQLLGGQHRFQVLVQGHPRLAHDVPARLPVLHVADRGHPHDVLPDRRYRSVGVIVAQLEREDAVHHAIPDHVGQAERFSGLLGLLGGQDAVHGLGQRGAVGLDRLPVPAAATLARCALAFAGGLPRLFTGGPDRLLHFRTRVDVRLDKLTGLRARELQLPRDALRLPRPRGLRLLLAELRHAHSALALALASLLLLRHDGTRQDEHRAADERLSNPHVEPPSDQAPPGPDRLQCVLRPYRRRTSPPS